MQERSINVKVVKETKSKVTIKFCSLNRKMPVSRNEFNERVESGLYNVIG